jgi:glutathione S-transferase
MTQPDSSDLALYQYQSCPYCARVRMALERLGVTLEIRDTQREPARRAELIREGGQSMVPCLRIAHPDGRVQWLYESADIIAYLQRRFGQP